MRIRGTVKIPQRFDPLGVKRHNYYFTKVVDVTLGLREVGPVCMFVRLCAYWDCRIALKPFQPWIYLSHLHPLQAANCCRNSRLVVDEDDLMWFKIKKNCHVLVNQFHGNIYSETLGCGKIKCFFRDVKWCFNASWGLKGLSTTANRLHTCLLPIFIW